MFANSEIQRAKRFVLKVVERELSLGISVEQKEKIRLQKLLDETEEDTARLNEILCQKIDNKVLSCQDESLLENLWIKTMEKLSVDNPNYAAYVKELTIKK